MTATESAHEITYNDMIIGHVRARIVTQRPERPVIVRLGREPIFPAEGEHDDEYYARNFALHGAGSIQVHTAPAHLPEPRQHTDGQDPDQEPTRLYAQVEITFRDTLVSEDLAAQLTSERSPAYRYMLVPQAIRAVYHAIELLDREGTEDVFISSDACAEMRRLGLCAPRPVHPRHTQWTPRPAAKKQPPHAGEIRARHPVLMPEGEHLAHPNIALALALLTHTDHTPVRVSDTENAPTAGLPTATVSEIGCVVGSQLVPAKEIGESAIVDDIELSVDLYGPGTIESFKVSAPFFLDSSDPHRRFTGRAGTLLVSRRDTNLSVESVMGQIAPSLTTGRENAYRTFLIQALNRSEEASEAALSHLVNRGMRYIGGIDSQIESAIRPGTSVRRGDYVVTYSPETEETHG